MTATLKLRPATVDDLDAIWSIEHSVFGAEAWSREMMREELTADHRVYLALVDDADTVAGYGGVLVVGEESDVQTIAVDASVRGAGHGRAIMHALLEAAGERGALFTFLEVRADNVPARTLYASMGFVEVGIRPGYYQPDNIDAVVMRLDLGERP